jgi:GNAT superfamily N-acetyltransferase
MSKSPSPPAEVTRHDDPLAFLAAARGAYDSDPATESQYAAQVYVLVQHPATAEDRIHLATCPEGAAVQRGAGPALIGGSTPRAARLLADDLADDWPQLQGVVGSVDGCLAFVRRWRERTGRGHRLSLRLRQHRLTAVRSLPTVPGQPRVAGVDDVAWIVSAQLAFIAETGVSDPPADALAIVPRRAAAGEYWLWECNGPVAYAGFADAAPATARIAPVYTDAACRRCGYATALVAALSRELLARGKAALFLATDVANPTANAVYARVGFEPICEQAHFSFIEPDAAADGGARC